MRLQLLFGFTLALALLTSCSDRPSPIDEANADGVLLLGNGEEPNTLDPHVAATVAEAHILYALFEGLVSPDPENPQSIAPGVATRWEFDESANRYVFHLRADALWSDGSPVTAADFVSSVKRALDPEFGAPYPEIFFDLKNARAYLSGELDDFESVGIEAIADRQLEITLGRPAPHFLQKLKHFAWLPVPVRVLEERDSLSRGSNPWAVEGAIISNGPFVLDSWVRNSIIETSRSKTYWDAENVTPQGVHFYPYENAELEYRAFQSRQLHVTDKIPVAALDAPLAPPAIKKSDPFLATSYLLANTDSPKLANPRFRQALARAIDKRSLARDVNRSGNPATSFTPDALGDYAPPLAESYDPNAARTLLRQAFPSGQDIPELNFIVSNIPASRAVAEALQAMWKETLGIEVTVTNMEAKTLFASLNEGDFELSYLTWSADYEDPSAFLDMWNSRNRPNRARWSNPDYNALLERASLEQEPSERLNLLAEAESILLAQSPIIPLIWKTKDYYIDASVANWPPAPIDMRSYKRVQLKTNP